MIDCVLPCTAIPPDAVRCSKFGPSPGALQPFAPAVPIPILIPTHARTPATCSLRCTGDVEFAFGSRAVVASFLGTLPPLPVPVPVPLPLPLLPVGAYRFAAPSNLLSSFFSPSSPSSLFTCSLTHSLTHSLRPSLPPSSTSQCSARLSPVCHCFAVSVEGVTKFIVRSSRPHRTTPHTPHRTLPHVTSCTGSPAPDRRTQHSLRLPRSNVGLSPARPIPRPRPLAGSLATADPQSKKSINPSRPLSSDPSNPDHPDHIPGPEHRIPMRHKSPAPSVWKSISHRSAPARAVDSTLSIVHISTSNTRQHIDIASLPIIPASHKYPGADRPPQRLNARSKPESWS